MKAQDEALLQALLEDIPHRGTELCPKVEMTPWMQD